MIRKTKKNLDESMIDDYYGNSEGLLERMNTFYQMWQEYISSIDTDGWDCEGFAGELHYWIRDVGINRADYNMVESYITERGVQSDSGADFDEYEWAVKWSGDDYFNESLHEARENYGEITNFRAIAGAMVLASLGTRTKYGKLFSKELGACLDGMGASKRNWIDCVDEIWVDKKTQRQYDHPVYAKLSDALLIRVDTNVDSSEDLTTFLSNATNTMYYLDHPEKWARGSISYVGALYVGSNGEILKYSGDSYNSYTFKKPSGMSGGAGEWQKKNLAAPKAMKGRVILKDDDYDDIIVPYEVALNLSKDDAFVEAVFEAIDNVIARVDSENAQRDHDTELMKGEYKSLWTSDDSTMKRLAKGHQDEISKMLEPQMAGNMSMARAGIASGWRLPDEFKQKYGPEGNGEFTADELRKLELYMAHNGYDDDFNYSKDNIYLKRKAESTLDEDFEDLEDNPNVLKFKKDPDDVAEELEPIIEQVFDDGGMTEGFLDVVCWQSTNDLDGSDYTCVITLTDGALETKEDLNIAVEEVLVDRLDEIGYDMSFDYVEDSKQYDAAMDIGLRLWVQ